MQPTSPVIDSAIQEAIKQASPRGWEAIILVIVMAMLIGLTSVIVRWLIKSMDVRLAEGAVRENRMANRVNDLEAFVEHTLIKVVNDTSSMTATVLEAVRSLVDALNERPCLLTESEKRQVHTCRLRTANEEAKQAENKTP
jgi:CheY-specific phosphatase CheX